ncbi:MAG: hypothetical protein ACLFPS_05790 [Clostridia bacterium]
MEIKKVKERRDGIKYILIPKNSELKKEDLVLITNNLKLISKFQEEEKNA